ncbi:hypothetical protein D3C81_1814070 [compost metagenome]
MTELAQARPVLRAPEQLPCGLDPNRITTVLGVLQLGCNLVVDDGRRHRPLISRAHGAIGMLTQMTITGLLPLVTITPLCAAAPPFIAHADCSAAPRRAQPSSPTNGRKARWLHQRRGKPRHCRSQQPSLGCSSMQWRALPSLDQILPKLRSATAPA